MDSPAHYELLDHTADLGVRVSAPSLPELLPVAVEALYAAIGTLCPAASTLGSQVMECRGSDKAELLRDFLADLLYRFETRGEIATWVQPIEYSSARLAARVAFAALDRERSDLQREVKAVTYHELSLETTPAGAEAHFIVDI